MKFEERIENENPNYVSEDYGFYDGFYAGRGQAAFIARQADELIEKLFDALCNRNADDYVDKLREEYGFDQ